MTLLGLVLLVALVVYVLNLGDRVADRTALQHRADAAARAAADWLARSLNTVAMNNVAYTQYIATINVMDGTPLAANLSLDETILWRESLAAQIERGVGDDPENLVNFVHARYTQLLSELDSDIEHVQTMVDAFEDVDVSEMTHFAGADGPGHIWRAMYAMDQAGQATMENLADTTQLACQRAGTPEDVAEDEAGTVLIPLRPMVPWWRGRFDDFERPVTRGRLPASIDDEVVRRGPYDTVFGWHRAISRRVGGTWDPGDGASGRGHVVIGSGAGGGGQWIGGQWIADRYDTYGTQQWLLRRVDRWIDRLVKHARLSWRIQQIANRNLAQLWPAHAGSQQERAFLIPDWIIHFPEASQFAGRDRQRVRETAFFFVEIKSRYPVGDDKFLSAGSWAMVSHRNVHNPGVVVRRSWVDPRRWRVPMVEDYVWRDEWQYSVFYDHSIGIIGGLDSNGEPLRFPVYRIDHFAFAGINVGEPVEVRNPYAGFDRNADDAPAPIMMRHDEVGLDDESRRTYLTLLAVSRRRDRAVAWPTRFSGTRPYPHAVAMAQAHVFNNHSWDLWTQMWQGQLQPIEDYESWRERLAADLGALDGSGTADVSERELKALHTYMLSAGGLAAVMLEH